MINQSTANKLIEMRLTAMADAFRIQMNDSSIKDTLQSTGTSFTGATGSGKTYMACAFDMEAWFLCSWFTGYSGFCF